MIKEKIQSRLRSMGANLSKERLAEWTERLANKLNDEANDEDINNHVDGFEDFIKEQAKQDDRLRSLEAELKKKPTEPNAEQAKTEKVETKDETLELLRALTEKVTNLETQKVQGDLTNRFLNNPELKGLPESLTKRFIPKSEDEFDTNLEELKALALETKLGNYGQDTPPSGKSGADFKPAPLDDRMKRLANKI